MIQRYDLHQVHRAGQQQRGEMIEGEDGEYVAYDDVKHFLPPLEHTRDELFERVAAAIDGASIGYSIKLTRLVDGVAEYTLSFADGREPLVFPDYAEANEIALLRILLLKAQAAITAVAGFPLAHLAEATKEGTGVP